VTMKSSGMWIRVIRSLSTFRRNMLPKMVLRSSEGQRYIFTLYYIQKVLCHLFYVWIWFWQQNHNTDGNERYRSLCINKKICSYNSKSNIIAYNTLWNAYDLSFIHQAFYILWTNTTFIKHYIHSKNTVHCNQYLRFYYLLFKRNVIW
jgi:hypothetical protein